jgi:UBX domain-containing protein 1/4
MAQYIVDPAEFAKLISKSTLTVVDFTASWCGPCKRIAPIYDGLAEKYQDVTFLKVDVDEAKDIAGQQGVRAMPTFKFFINSKQVDELQGADPAKLEELVVKHRVAPAFGGQGHTMGTAGSAADAAAARLARFGAAPAPHPAPAPTSHAVGTASTNGNVEDEDEELAKAIARSMEQSSPPPPSTTETEATASTSSPAKESSKTGSDSSEDKGEEGDPNELVPLPVDATMLAEMVAMGFSDIRARKGLHYGNNVEAAITWISDHENEANIDDEYLVKRGDINKKPLTEEEMKIKMQELKILTQKRRAEREEKEKKDAIRIEKERRERDQKTQVTQAEREAMQRKRDAEKMRKEKADAKAEKARIMAEIARDKEIRLKNKGILPSVLGVDGYNPNAIQYEQKNDPITGLPIVPTDNGEESQPKAAPAPSLDNVDDIIDKSISNLMKYRTRGDGGNALKLLSLFVKNVAEKPTELKYRSISTESNAYKTKIAPFVGGGSLLKALGFEKGDEEGKLVLKVAETDTTSFLPLFTTTLSKITAAANIFAQENP